MKLAFVMMQKDETSLLSLFINYHARFSGYDSLFIIDNGSSNSTTLSLLSAFESHGVNIIRQFSSAVDFENKGERVLRVLRSYDIQSKFQFIFPMDCDELLCLHKADTLDLTTFGITAYLQTLSDPGLGFRINRGFTNIVGLQNKFVFDKRMKVFFSASSQLKRLDVGFHLRTLDLLCPTTLGYLHLHNRSFFEVLRCARDKLRARVSTFTPNEFNRLRSTKGGRGTHLTKYFSMSAESYANRIPSRPVLAANLTKVAQDIGESASLATFSNTTMSSPDEIFWLQSPNNYHAISEDVWNHIDTTPDRRAIILAFSDKVPGCPNGNSLLTPQQSYGWLHRAPSHFRDRGLSDPLLSSFVFDRAEVTYGVNLPPGSYRVTALAFDPLYSNHSVGIQVLDTTIAPSPIRTSHVTRLECCVLHSGGLLKVRIFSDRSNLILNGLAFVVDGDSTNAASRSEWKPEPRQITSPSKKS